MDAEEKKLWQLYRKTGRHELMEVIVEKYLHIVHYLANKLSIFSSGTLDREDLYSAGVIGLIEAMQKFDPERGFEFQTFATIRVRGAIIDEIRRTDWVPRSVRKKSKRIDAAIHALFNSLGRMPTDEEIAEELDMTIEEYYQITDNLGPLFLASLDAVVPTDGEGNAMHIADVIEDPSESSAEEKYLQQNLRKRISDAISELPDKEKLVVALYYYEELTLKEIGMVLDVTESRVSQMHSSALMKLRSVLKNVKLKDLY